ncbi:unnamed protein product [Darwinula stevensoni]|uniref:Major facilitator superfamily (MFS) profile domain-containing protein n=1 Tax=Darwinula stevensoni TaxID=69355 RepID=A0A7R9AGW3_9CRUS|nr:unnamed protein product [Darwinula stevensoni]CAG0904635.1 unnamed protein product [Darwinula stevensoni]
MATLPQDLAMEKGVSSEDSSFLLSVIGIANTLGRVTFGYICDHRWLYTENLRRRLWLYNIAIIVCGLSTALTTRGTSYGVLVLTTSVFGCTSGAYVGLTSVILVDLLGIEALTNAFGLVLLFNGIASLFGPPIAGWLYDRLGSYDSGFYVAGTVIALSGLMLFCIPLVETLQAPFEGSRGRKSRQAPFEGCQEGRTKQAPFEGEKKVLIGGIP